MKNIAQTVGSQIKNKVELFLNNFIFIEFNLFSSLHLPTKKMKIQVMILTEKVKKNNLRNLLTRLKKL